jgi:flagellin-like hook-associated protein FlgL
VGPPRGASLNQGVLNINDATNSLQIADGAMSASQFTAARQRSLMCQVLKL